MQTISMRDFFGKNPTKMTMNAQLGATLTPRLLLGADLSAFVATANYHMMDGGDAKGSMGIGTLSAMATFFPLGAGPFVRGGIGLARWSTSLEQPGAPTITKETGGYTFNAGAGYAFWIGRSFNVTADVAYSMQVYTDGDPTVPDGSSFWSAGLGFGWY